MAEAKTISVSNWGGALGVRLPKEYVDKTGITNKSKIQTKIIGSTLLLSLPEIQRNHIPLAVRMENSGQRGGEPANPTEEDSEWLNMPSVGEELPW